MHDLAPLKLASPAVADWSRARIRARLESGFGAVHLKRARSVDPGPGRKLGLPEMLTSARIGVVEAFSIAPDEWLLIASVGSVHELIKMRGACEALGFVWVDCQSSIQILEVYASANLVASLAGLPDCAIKPGAVARTRLADIPVVIAANTGSVRLLFDRTYAPHLRAWLDCAI